MTPPFILRFPYLFEQSTKMETQEENGYSINMCFRPEDLASEENKARFEAMKNAANLAGIERFGEERWARIKTNRQYPLFKTSKNFANWDEEKYPEIKDCILVNAGSKEPPGVVQYMGVGKKPVRIVDKLDIRAGDLCVATIQAFGYPKKGKPEVNVGVSFGLLNIMRIGEGIPLTNRRKAEDDFAEVDFGQPNQPSYDYSGDF